MCGIVGYVGNENALPFLVQGLKRLEYRGYDSAGVAYFIEDHFEITKASGKIENVEALLNRKALPEKTKAGIGHTRWATHGKPNSINAHPHRTGHTVLVHNGIIENYEDIRQELIDQGYAMVSETDSELFGHLVEEQLKQKKTFIEAVRQSFLRLKGACSIVVVHDKDPDLIIAVRNGTPLVVGYSAELEGCFIASDAQAILEYTRNVVFLENEDFVLCRKTGFEVYSLRDSNRRLARPETVIDWSLSSMDKAGFPHYMLKEIHEQPRAILDTLDFLVDRETARLKVDALGAYLKKTKRIQLIGCGSAWHAALIGKYILEIGSRIPVEVDLASEYRYRNPVVDESTLVIGVSQSGETADTLAALREAKDQGAMVAGICNVRGSTLTREVPITLFTAAGPEIGVASTKAFTTQILNFMLLGEYFASIKKSEEYAEGKHFDLHLYLKIPHLIERALASAEKIRNVARECVNSKGFLFIGRGPLFPIALEGALKMKEISYLHAEGYPAGELKHGPIAMVDSSMTIVVLAPRDDLYEKTISNLQEVKARGGKIIGVGSEGDEKLKQLSDYFLDYPFQKDWTDPMLATIPMQLLSYEVAVLKGTDVDKPRNLAKSVTVE